MTPPAPHTSVSSADLPPFVLLVRVSVICALIFFAVFGGGWLHSRRQAVVQWRNQTVAAYESVAEQVEPGRGAPSAEGLISAMHQWTRLAQIPFHERARVGDMKRVANAQVRAAERLAVAVIGRMAQGQGVITPAQGLELVLGLQSLRVPGTKFQAVSEEELRVLQRQVLHSLYAMLTPQVQQGIPLREIRRNVELLRMAQKLKVAQEETVLFEFLDHFRIREAAVSSAMEGMMGSRGGESLLPQRHAFAERASELLGDLGGEVDVSAIGEQGDTLAIRGPGLSSQLASLFLVRPELRSQLVDLGFLAVQGVGVDEPITLSLF